MAQRNIYDNPSFFSAYRGLKDGDTKQGTVGGGLTHDDLTRILPPLKDTSILDLGCGDGWFSYWAVTCGGAAKVKGLDSSILQIRAAQSTAARLGDDQANKLTYQIADLNTLTPVKNTYHIVFSSLTLHYLRDLKGLMESIFASLKPGGMFYFTVEHPIYTAPTHREVCTHPATTKTAKDGEGRHDAETQAADAHWRLNGYWDQGPRTHSWLGHEVEKQHWKMETYVNSLVGTGFELVYMHEWPRVDDGKHKAESWWLPTEVGPTYLMLGARKREN